MNIRELNEKILLSLSEFALDRDTVKRGLTVQAKPIFQHTAQLQLLGYESTAIQTLYDIIDDLDDNFNTVKKARKYMNEKNIKEWLIDYVEDEEEYLYRIEKFKRKKHYNNQINVSYKIYQQVTNYLIDILSKDIVPEREEFYRKIKEIMFGEENEN